MTLNVALYPAPAGFATRDLLGRPVWERTLAAVRGLGAHRALWIRTNGKSASAAPEGTEALDPRDLASLDDTVLLLPAELPCLRTKSLKALLKGGRSQALATAAGGPARALAGPASELSRALPDFNGFSSRRAREVFERLSPRSIAARDENEMLLIEDWDSWARAVAVLRQRKVDELLRRGVRILDPGSVFVEPEVEIGKGATLHPWVHLQGATSIGAGSSIGSFSHIVDSTLGAGTTVLDHCFIRSSRIGRNVQIGPFAHLRPESDIGAGAKVGNFVELKKTRLGPGAKAPHLSYLGDAVVGRGVNVGAGTITCNYDGVQKHQTVIEAGAFIGSDVQLVAPVRVGRGAYVAAGSCIVEDVPAYSLALARSRQVVKSGWAKSRKRG